MLLWVFPSKIFCFNFVVFELVFVEKVVELVFYGVYSVMQSCAHGVEYGSVGVITAMLGSSGMSVSTIARVMSSVKAKSWPSSEFAVMFAPLFILSSWFSLVGSYLPVGFCSVCIQISRVTISPGVSVPMVQLKKFWTYSPPVVLFWYQSTVPLLGVAFMGSMTFSITS